MKSYIILFILMIVAILLVCCNKLPLSTSINTTAGMVVTPSLSTPLLPTSTSMTNPILAEVTVTVSQKPSSTPTASPIRILPTQTYTPFSPTYSPTPELTPTVSSWMILRTQCLEVTTELPEEFRGTGSIFLWRMQGSSHSYTLNMETGEKIQLLDDWRYWEWRISPGEQWMAFQPDSDPYTVKVMNLAGEVQKTIHWDDNWLLGDWVNDESFEIYKLVDPAQKKYSLTLYNPFTGKQQIMPIDYPDIYTLGAMFFPLAYDPTLSRLVYPYKAKEEMGFKLWDVRMGKQIATVPSIISLSGGPRWSPNGQQVLVTGLPDFPNWEYFEFFLVNLNGVVTQLTDLKAYKAKISINRLNSYSWSPDGRYIAYWFRFDQDPIEHLAVIDINTREMVDYCVLGDEPPGTYPPIWSPDSQQLIVFNSRPEMTATVVDIKNGRGATVGLLTEPVFWLRNIPKDWINNVP